MRSFTYDSSIFGQQPHAAAAFSRQAAMVLKFCTGFWPGSGSAREDAVKKPGEARTPTLVGASSSTVRVFFDATRNPIGLGFQRAARADYECVVSEISPDGLAAQHNASRVAKGDLTRMVVAQKSAVRMINSEDVKGVAYASVLQKMHAAKPAFFLTFGPAEAEPEPRTQSLQDIARDSVAANRMKTRNSTVTLTAPSAPSSRPVVGLKDADNKGVDDTKAKRESILDAVQAALVKERDEANAQLSQLQQRHCALQEQVSGLEQRLDEQTLAMDEMQSRAERFRFERDELAQRWQELHREHQNTKQHADELHDRLVDAQASRRKSNESLETLQRVRALSSVPEESSSELDRLQAQELRQSLIRTVSFSGDNSAVVLDASESTAQFAKLKRSHHELQTHCEQLEIEASCHEHTVQLLKDQLAELRAERAADQQQIESLEMQVQGSKEEQRSVQERWETQFLKADTDARAVQDELKKQLQEMEQRCEQERLEKGQLQAALDHLEAKARARIEDHEKELEQLALFKKELATGLLVTKYGARGKPHTRVLFSDADCHWISWAEPPSASSAKGASMALAKPKMDAKADTNDLVAVLSGATSDIFLRNRPENANRCFSLVFAHPCRTVDLQTESVERCRFYVRGFHLLQEEAAHQRDH